MRGVALLRPCGPLRRRDRQRRLRNRIAAPTAADQTTPTTASHCATAAMPWTAAYRAMIRKSGRPARPRGKRRRRLPPRHSWSPTNSGHRARSSCRNLSRCSVSGRHTLRFQRLPSRVASPAMTARITPPAMATAPKAIGGTSPVATPAMQPQTPARMAMAEKISVFRTASLTRVISSPFLRVLRLGRGPRPRRITPVGCGLIGPGTAHGTAGRADSAPWSIPVNARAPGAQPTDRCRATRPIRLGSPGRRGSDCEGDCFATISAPLPAHDQREGYEGDHYDYDAPRRKGTERSSSSLNTGLHRFSFPFLISRRLTSIVAGILQVNLSAGVACAGSPESWPTAPSQPE